MDFAHQQRRTATSSRAATPGTSTVGRWRPDYGDGVEGQIEDIVARLRGWVCDRRNIPAGQLPTLAQYKTTFDELVQSQGRATANSATFSLLAKQRLRSGKRCFTLAQRAMINVLRGMAVSHLDNDPKNDEISWSELESALVTAERQYPGQVYQ